uniref:Uncharacterized protein n=1 Tax=Ditylenchus dipsaci TaxID=166011 RepID=A0A915CWI5_9BILA
MEEYVTEKLDCVRFGHFCVCLSNPELRNEQQWTRLKSRRTNFFEEIELSLQFHSFKRKGYEDDSAGPTTIVRTEDPLVALKMREEQRKREM